MHVLLVEDEPDIQLIARYTLEDAGYQVTVAANGSAALELALSQSFDVVLLDVMMPDMDGYTTCRQLRTLPYTRGLPVIFLTAKTQETEVREGLELGAIGYIRKPFDVDTLAQEIVTLLQAHS